jgi:hypothetical protein
MLYLQCCLNFLLVLILILLILFKLCPRTLGLILLILILLHLFKTVCFDFNILTKLIPVSFPSEGLCNMGPQSWRDVLEGFSDSPHSAVGDVICVPAIHNRRFGSA